MDLQTDLAEDEISSLLAWIDDIPLSRPKRNITRDFSDGVAAAEVVHHFCPKLVDMHNYSPANSVSQKLYNWNTLNRVFRKLSYVASQELISCIVGCRPGHVEYLLYELRKKIESYLAAKARIRDISGFSSPVDRMSNPSHSPGFARRSGNGSKASLAPGLGQPALPTGSAPGGMGGGVALQGVHGAAANGVGHGGAMSTEPHDDGRGNGARPVADDQNWQASSKALNTANPDQKDIMIRELQETIQILHVKVVKLEQLLTLKDRRIDELTKNTHR
ncbi:Sperm flagellar protein 1 [Irineochytrium annulatum]|nr:Sperm flagellar protein 1 [Irineochytrium annulatum]